MLIKHRIIYKGSNNEIHRVLVAEEVNDTQGKNDQIKYSTNAYHSREVEETWVRNLPKRENVTYTMCKNPHKILSLFLQNNLNSPSLQLEHKKT